MSDGEVDVEAKRRVDDSLATCNGRAAAVESFDGQKVSGGQCARHGGIYSRGRSEEAMPRVDQCKCSMSWMILVYVTGGEMV